jgi:protein-arginine kinase activator protein McsA
VRQRYEIGRTLDEQLAEAIRLENYELAAQIRDKLRGPGSG